MKTSRIFSSIALSMLLAGGLASCSNEMPAPGSNDGNMLVGAPKAIAYSGTTSFGLGTRSAGTRSGAGVTSQPCETTLIDRAHEEEIINEWLPEKNGNLKEGIDSDFLFYADEDLSLEFYPVFSQTSTQNSLGVFYYDPDGEYHEVIVWENMDPYGLTKTEWKWSEEKGSYAEVTSKGIQINVPAGCTFGFYWSGNLYGGVSTTYYSDSSKNEETFCTDGGGGKLEPEQLSKIHAVTFQLEGKTYLGLEDWTDFDFQDWVFTCDKELKTVDASTFVPGETPDPTPNPTPDPVDPTPDPVDPTPGPGDPTPDPEDPENPSIGDVVREGLGEVEVNLAADEKEDGSFDSHLSIHVRTATNVDVFIPVPAEYYCEADDMAIVMQHEPNHMGHGGPYEFTWQLKDSDLSVSLFVEYLPEGIHIWTEGISQEVIDWCYEKCEDGITFEVWNYYNEEADLDLIKDFLNQSLIRFRDKTPDIYINSFVDDNDCTVDIVEDQKGEYNPPYEGEHLNGSDHNQIYDKKAEKEEPKPTPPPVPTY